MQTNIRKRSIFSLALVATGLSSAILIQDSENRLVAKQCGHGIYTIGAYQTGVGPVYKCVSNVQAYGPALPLPD